MLTTASPLLLTASYGVCAACSLTTPVIGRDYYFRRVKFRLLAGILLPNLHLVEIGG